MRNLFSFLSLMVLGLLFFCSCRSGGSGEVYNLKMRLNTNDTFVQDMEMKMLMNTSGIKMNMTMNIGITFKVLDGNADQKDIKITYTKMNMNMDMANMKGAMPDSTLNNAYKNIIGKSVIIKLSKDNQITEVTGFDELMNSMARDSMQKEMAKKMFSKDQLKNTFGMMFSMYPQKPVRVGESWNSETTTGMGNMDMNIANKYTLLSVRNGLAEVDIDGKVGADMLKGPSGMKMDMSGTQKGTITIRTDNGYLHHASYKMDVKADMQMMGHNVPMTINANCEMKGI